MNGKGSKQRPGDLGRYRDGHDRIFGKKRPSPTNRALNAKDRYVHDAAHMMLGEYQILQHKYAELERAAMYVLQNVDRYDWALDHLRHALGLYKEKK